MLFSLAAGIQTAADEKGPAPQPDNPSQLTTRAVEQDKPVADKVDLSALVRELRKEGREINPATLDEAKDLFEQMVKAYRSGSLRETCLLTSFRGTRENILSKTDTFTFLFDNRGRVKFDLDDLQITAPRDGRLIVMHSRVPDLYFETKYEGDLSNDVFLDNFDLFPFPEIPLVLAEDPLWEFFMMSPLEIYGSGVKKTEKGSYLLLVLDGPENRIVIRLDPNTRLMKTMLVDFKMAGAGRERYMLFRLQNEYLKGIDPAEFEPDLAGRKRVDDLDDLQPPEPEVEEGNADNQGENAAEPEATQSLTGKPLLVFSLPDLDGRVMNSEALKGQVLVLDLWATWCPPCRASLPYLNKAAAQAKEEKLPVQFFAVNVWENAENNEARTKLVRDFWEKNDYKVTVLLDHENKLAGSLKVPGIPFTVIVRPDGIIHTIHIGADLGHKERIVPDLLNDVREALQEAQKAEKPAEGS